MFIYGVSSSNTTLYPLTSSSDRIVARSIFAKPVIVIVNIFLHISECLSSTEIDSYNLVIQRIGEFNLSYRDSSRFSQQIMLSVIDRNR